MNEYVPVSLVINLTHLSSILVIKGIISYQLLIPQIILTKSSPIFDIRVKVMRVILRHVAHATFALSQLRACPKKNSQTTYTGTTINMLLWYGKAIQCDI